MQLSKSVEVSHNVVEIERERTTMVKTIIEQFASFGSDLTTHIPPGLPFFIAPAFIEGGRYAAAYRHELVGTLLMIAFTFSAGKWIGKGSSRVAWGSHALGVIAADYVGRGPNVNPAMTVTMWALGKLSYTESYVRIAGQLTGGLVAFPLYHAVATAIDLEPFGGPEYNMSSGGHATAEAFLSEFFATILLCFVIYTVNWEFNFGKYHYIIKQSLTAIGIRALIEAFPTSGPAMNPMLATSWYVFGVGKKFKYPNQFEHYFVYWVGPFAAAIVAAACYGIYSGNRVFGKTMPIGPYKRRVGAKTPVFKKKV